LRDQTVAVTALAELEDASATRQARLEGIDAVIVLSAVVAWLAEPASFPRGDVVELRNLMIDEVQPAFPV
jgi:hypothetical protein